MIEKFVELYARANSIINKCCIASPKAKESYISRLVLSILSASTGSFRNKSQKRDEPKERERGGEERGRDETRESFASRMHPTAACIPFVFSANITKRLQRRNSPSSALSLTQECSDIQHPSVHRLINVYHTLLEHY